MPGLVKYRLLFQIIDFFARVKPGRKGKRMGWVGGERRIMHLFLKQCRCQFGPLLQIVERRFPWCNIHPFQSIEFCHFCADNGVQVPMKRGFTTLLPKLWFSREPIVEAQRETMTKKLISKFAIACTVAVVALAAPVENAKAEPIAKKLFGAKRDAAALKPAVHGSYAKGCVAGAARLPDDGPNWQAMRLSRNRHWAHPELINTVIKLSQDGKKVGWNGLLVGDLTQPRGGPMLTGHASHQAGLDADVWLTPMPDRRLTRKEREQLSATSMLARRSNGKLTNQKLDNRRFTKAHAGIIRTAAQYGNVERIFVHPTIKRELCRQYPSKPGWLKKVRAQFGHHYHFHIRIGCPQGSPGCKPQRAVPSYGCDKATMDYWFKVAYGPPRKPKPGAKPKPRKPKRQIRMGDLPQACRVVLNAPGYNGALDTVPNTAFVATAQPSPAEAATQFATIGDVVTKPTFRPNN